MSSFQTVPSIPGPALPLPAQNFVADDKDASLPWFGVRTRSNHEKVAASVLGGKGYVQYLPTYKSMRRRSDRDVEIDRPLFPGYVFCRFDPKARLPILTTPGVVSIIGFGNEPAPIEELEIEAIRIVLRSGLATEPCVFLREGQKIRVKRGALEGLEGILIRKFKKKNEFRMVVSLSMLQRSIAVEVDPDSIGAV